MNGINQQEFQIVCSIKNTKPDVVIENVCVGWDGGSQRSLLQRDNIEAQFSKNREGQPWNELGEEPARNHKAKALSKNVLAYVRYRKKASLEGEVRREVRVELQGSLASV